MPNLDSTDSGSTELEPTYQWVTDAELESLIETWGLDRSMPWRDFARAVLALASAPPAPVAWQWQHLIGNPDVCKPFWTDWAQCTQRQYEFAIANPDFQGRELYAVL